MNVTSGSSEGVEISFNDFNHFQKENWGLEKWLSNKKHCLLFQMIPCSIPSTHIVGHKYL